ncbi:hypothetical protein EDB19DRAFT_1609647, partial [Suillus lakei]
FSDLPTEIALLILEEAARPTFSQCDKYSDRNPYSSALALCRVSRKLRHAVLPYMLDTILLPQLRNVRAFVNALHIQKKYTDDLSIDYASVVRKIWIGEHGGNLAENPLLNAYRAPECELSLSLLAPVLLAAPSLALDWTSLILLSDCLEHVCKSRPDMTLASEYSPPPWETRSLTLSGTSARAPWWPFTTTTTQGLTAFLASLCHLTYL